MLEFTVKIAPEPDGKKMHMTMIGGGMGTPDEQRFAEHIVQAIINADVEWRKQHGLDPSKAHGFIGTVDPKDN